MTERVTLAAGTVQTLCDMLEALRTALPLDTEVSADLAARLARTRAGMVGAVTVGVVAGAVGDLCDLVRDLGREADPVQMRQRAAGLLPSLTVAVPSTSSPALLLASDFARAASACVEAALLAEVAVAVAERVYSDRAAAQAACSDLAALAEASLERIAATGAEAVWHAASEAVRHAIDHLGRGALDLSPVVMVEALRAFPSTVLAWRLYGDPERAGELVDRNGVSTPLFFPATFEALAS